MSETRPLRPREPGATRTRIVLGSDLDTLAQLYWTSFPERVARMGREGPARARLRDQLQLLCCSYPHTSFVAEREGRLAGFLILKVPAGGLLPSTNPRALRRRVLLRALTGTYGLPLRAAFDAGLSRLGELFAGLPLRGTPHVAVIAVDPAFTRCGVGSALLSRAREECTGSFRAIWLNVETDHASAISFYEHLGFRCVGRGPREQRMWLDLPGVGEGANR